MSDGTHAPAVDTSRPPDGVPANAFWDSRHQFWRVGAISDGGVLQGAHRLYRPSGALFAEVSYVDGKAEGKYRRYHPNGEVAREGEYSRGTPVGLEVAYASSAKTDEPLQKCCVPPGAVKLVLKHFEAGYFEEDFYDTHDRVLLPDGALQPERPPTVAPEARYKPQEKVWCTQVYVGGKRGGTWRYWSCEGELLESAEYADNQLHGLREVWRAGSVQSAWQYVRGVRHGQGWELVPVDTYENRAIVCQSGEFENGIRAGIWRYKDAKDHILLHVDVGSALVELSEHEGVFAESIPEAFAWEHAHPLVRYWVTLRNAARQGTDALRHALADRPTWVAARSERWLSTLKREGLAKGPFLARLVEGLRFGAVAQDVLGVMAHLLLGSPGVALSLTDLGLLLAPEHVELLGVRVLALIELGKLPEAWAAAQALEHLHPSSYADLTALLRVTFPAFGFWPENVALEGASSDELPDAVAQDISRIRQTMAKVALRLSEVCAAVQERLTENEKPTWSPPELCWSSTEAATLERYEFDVSGDDDEPADHIVVDETLDLRGYTLSDLMNRARIEWTALCWLAFGVGLDRVSLPEEVLANANFGRALTTAFTRLYRVADQLKTRGYRARAQGLADAEWEGLAISNLPERLLIQARAEFSEMRAALYFLADDSCKSLWQDDLRG